MNSQRIAIVGLGNCASSLLQGLDLFRDCKLKAEDLGMNPIFHPSDLDEVEFVCAFDIDRRKVGFSVTEAIFAAPNKVPNYGGEIKTFSFPILRGPTLDGISPTMAGRRIEEVFWADEAPSVDVSAQLKRYEVTLVLCLLPTGAVEACDAYARAACDAGAGFINGTATPLARRKDIQALFAAKELILIGDDFKSQFGATFLNEALLDALKARRCRILQTTQTNVGGNTDFLNMQDRGRAEMKEESKRNALAAWLDMPATTCIGDYRPELGDTKLAEITIDAEGFARRRMKVSVRLEVEDSPNAAGTITTILAGTTQAVNRLSRSTLGEAISALTMKSPWSQMTEAMARQVLTRTGKYDQGLAS